MKKSLLIFGIVALSFTSCQKGVENKGEVKIDSTTISADKHNAMNSLDYQGTYIGSLPCADCEAIAITISLDETTYIKETVYKGKSEEVFKETGKYSWNKEGNTITLLGSDAPNQYFVGENRLIYLDSEGKSIEGDLASKYELAKVNNIETK